MAMTIVRFILSFAVLLSAVYIAAMNWGCVIVSLRNKRRGIDQHHSTGPFISFCFALVAAILYPHPDKAAWMLAVPALDIGNWVVLWALVWLPMMLIRELRKKRKTEPSADRENR
jgi:hypothetical protein